MTFRFPCRGICDISHLFEIEDYQFRIFSFHMKVQTYPRGNRGASMLKHLRK